MKLTLKMSCSIVKHILMISTWHWSMMEILEIARIIPMNICKQVVRTEPLIGTQPILLQMDLPLRVLDFDICLELRITIVDSTYDNITEQGHCGDMTNTDKEGLSVFSIPLMKWMGHQMERIGMHLGSTMMAMDVNHGDSITIYSPDSTDLYFTCVELHDNYGHVYR